MNNEMRNLLIEFIDEFNKTINSLVPDQTNIDGEILNQISNNLYSKYYKRINQYGMKKSIFKRIISKFSTASKNKTVVRPLIEQIQDDENYSIAHKEEYSKRDEYPKLDHLIQKQKELLTIQKSKEKNPVDSLLVNPLSLPRDIELAIVIDPLEEKDQDHADYFILDSGAVGLITCDGISGEGSKSGDFARALPMYITEYFAENFNEIIDSISYWEDFVTEAINYAIEKISLDSGATTLILALLSSDRKKIYFSWIGDGHGILFNDRLTGFSKILFPHRDYKKNLTAAVTSSGLIGKANHQIHGGPFEKGGTLIIATDGFDLTRGAVLNHLFTNVIRNTDLQNTLNKWISMNCCSDKKLHGEKKDDRSMIIIKWSGEE